MKLIFDIETDGLLHEMSTIHSLCMYDLDNGDFHSLYGDKIAGGIKLLQSADLLIGHNIIGFDIPAIQKLYPDFNIEDDKLHDTFILSKICNPQLKEKDAKRRKIPPYLWGSHGLEAWGQRLGMHKGDYKKEMKDLGIDPWAEWNENMQSYCEQDVKVTNELYKQFDFDKVPQQAFELETRFAVIIAKVCQRGVAFDEAAAVDLYIDMKNQRDELTEVLQEHFGDVVTEEEFIPKRDNSTKGYKAGVPVIKRKVEPFNVNSPKQIGEKLQEVDGWKPQVFTKGGQPSCTDDVLTNLNYPICEVLAKALKVKKLVGTLAEGNSAWLNRVRKGRLHGNINPVGTRTFRCTHTNPNLGNIPSVDAFMGRECRQLFKASEGMVLVGSDASSLELRCLAHYLAPYDGGEYARKIVSCDDVHILNMEMMGLASRGEAKTAIYALLYGQGAEATGIQLGGGFKEGKALQTRVFNGMPSLKRLTDDIVNACKKRGYLIAVDGTLLENTADHTAPNTTLQSAGSKIVKKATINMYDKMIERGYEWGKEWAMVLHVHDEWQIECIPEIAEEVAQLSIESFELAGKQLGIKCPITGESKIGNNWAETH